MIVVKSFIVLYEDFFMTLLLLTGSRLPFSFGLYVLKMHYEEITNGFRSDVKGCW